MIVKVKSDIITGGGINVEYSLNLGIWNSIFAVPSVIVDEHIKLAGATQLKVILWILRHSGEKFSLDDISKALNMQSADVKDCMQYWVQVGVISLNGNDIKPVDMESQTENDADTVCEQKEEDKKEEKKIFNSNKIDFEYTVKRIAENKDIAYLMEMADNLYGRLTSQNDKANLLFIHDNYGMPIEIIIMIMQYLKNINRCCTRSVQDMANKWYKKGIFDLEMADKEIKRLEAGNRSAIKIQKIIGDYHVPTEQEINTAELWMDQWNLSEELIRFAYETCVDSIGKYQPGYMKKIVENWHNKGIRSVEQAKIESESKRKAASKKSEKTDDKYNADWEILKKLSIADEV